jgi:hypothetical protein
MEDIRITVNRLAPKAEGAALQLSISLEQSTGPREDFLGPSEISSKRLI